MSLWIPKRERNGRWSFRSVSFVPLTLIVIALLLIVWLLAAVFSM